MMNPFRELKLDLCRLKDELRSGTIPNDAVDIVSDAIVHLCSEVPTDEELDIMLEYMSKDIAKFKSEIYEKNKHKPNILQKLQMYIGC